LKKNKGGEVDGRRGEAKKRITWQERILHPQSAAAMLRVCRLMRTGKKHPTKEREHGKDQKGVTQDRGSDITRSGDRKRVLEERKGDLMKKGRCQKGEEQMAQGKSPKALN